MLGEAALTALLAACPGPHPVTPRIAPIPSCGVTVTDLAPGWSIVGCYNAETDTITINRAVPRRLVCPTLTHELEHRTRYLAGDPSWWDHPKPHAR